MTRHEVGIELDVLGLVRNAAITLSCLYLCGCTSGVVRDALSGVAVESVAIELVTGDCIGSGCSAVPVSTLTDGYGRYTFDAYDAVSGKLLTPADGHESIELRLSKAGYTPVTIFHRPKYRLIDVANNSYLASLIAQVYLCLESSLDSDGDSICDDAELRYGTDPENSDSDGDSLSDAAEIYGYGGVDLRYFGAHPLHKDVFVEIDYYPGLKPETDAIQRVVEAFATAPVANPDGKTGIHLVADFSDEIDPADVVLDITSHFQYEIIRDKYFPGRRAPIFHYSLFANQLNGSISTGVSISVPASEFIVTLGGAWQGGTQTQQAGTFMHELGHNLGLYHGGYFDGQNYKPNYLSVMNYFYQLWGLKVDGIEGVLDYSRLQIDEVDETDLSESLAFTPVPGSGTTEADLARYGVFADGGSFLSGNASENLDFNRNGAIEEGVSVDLDGFGGASMVFRASKNDWDHLIYGGGAIGDPHLGRGREDLGASPLPAVHFEPCLPRLDDVRGLIK